MTVSQCLLAWVQVNGDALVLLSRLLHATHPEVRAAAVFALSICIQVRPGLSYLLSISGQAQSLALLLPLSGLTF